MQDVMQLSKLPKTPENQRLLTKAMNALESMDTQLQRQQQQSRGRYQTQPSLQDRKLKDATARMDDLLNDIALCNDIGRR